MRTSSRNLRGPRLILAPLLLAVLVAGCGDEDAKPRPYRQQTRPENVLYNLQVAYQERDCAGYGALLASDFRFHFDSYTRQVKHLPEYWIQHQDSTFTCLLLRAPEVTDIRVHVEHGPAVPVAGEAGRDGWDVIDTQDVFLEADLSPVPPQSEGVTMRVDGQGQRFYFRKGRAPADTLSTSPTARLYYLVEWVDYGPYDRAPARRPALASSPAPAIENTSWGAIKALFRI